MRTITIPSLSFCPRVLFGVIVFMDEAAEKRKDIYLSQFPWVEEKPGRKISRTMKVKLMFVSYSLKVQQTFRLNGDGLIKSMIAKKI